MQQKQLSGIFYAAFASLWWGVVGTIFFKFVSFASFIELTVHRTIWTALLLILTTSFYKKWPEFIKIFKKKKNQILLFISGLLVSINWGTWLYAVSVNRLLDSSLGYYIYPIISVFLGRVFLKEKLNNLPVLSNDTNDVIEFNNSFENEINDEKKRSFWDLLKNK